MTGRTSYDDHHQNRHSNRTVGDNQQPERSEGLAADGGAAFAKAPASHAEAQRRRGAPSQN
jgi:hypothetical protein